MSEARKYSWGATFYGKKKDKLGTLVFKDILSGEILIWKHVQSELVKDYKQLLQRLLDYGYVIKAIIIDGKRGLFKAFKDYPVKCVTLPQGHLVIKRKLYRDISLCIQD